MESASDSDTDMEKKRVENVKDNIRALEEISKKMEEEAKAQGIPTGQPKAKEKKGKKRWTETGQRWREDPPFKCKHKARAGRTPSSRAKRVDYAKLADLD